MAEHPQHPREKALKVNLDDSRYGSFAEIGAGQETVRWFFQAGGAAGTIAKSISAYDMAVSDAIYGKCARYVCRDRLEAMLNYEYDLTLERLATSRGGHTAFFSFANTVSARNYHGTNECHGWLGVRFQAEPGARASEIIIHVRMLDSENALQQEALGLVGVNLVYGACFLSDAPDLLVQSLLDGLSTDRLEVDMVDFSGAIFEQVDNRIMSLRLVQLGLSGAAMFAADGRVLQPSEHLRKKPVLVERGRFRPVTHVNIDMLESALSTMETEAGAESEQTVAIMEMALKNLNAGGEVDLDDFISRAEVLEAAGYTVLISDFPEYHRLATYLSRNTSGRIGLTMGAHSLAELFDESYYQNLPGGLLEGFGRLLKNKVKLYIYPYRDPATGQLITVDNLEIPDRLRHLYQHLRDNGYITQLERFNESYLDIFSPEVLEKIVSGQSGWEHQVPDVVADKIKRQKLFGHA